jgi:hypothetical protein
MRRKHDGKMEHDPESGHLRRPDSPSHLESIRRAPERRGRQSVGAHASDHYNSAGVLSGGTGSAGGPGLASGRGAAGGFGALARSE